MRKSDKLLEYLSNHTEGADDATIATALRLTTTEVNNGCRRLDAAGLVKRVRRGGVTHNVLVSGTKTSVERETDRVQQKIVSYLRDSGCQEVQTVSGKGISAQRDGRALNVAVRESPAPTTRASAESVARHWFKAAFFDVVDWRGKDSNASLYIGLPDVPAYRSMVRKVRWLAPQLKHRFLWVHENGTVKEEDAQQ